MIDIEKHHLPTLPLNATTKEHILPKSYGGIADRENLVAACSLCNYLRGNMDYIAFTNLIRRLFKRTPELKEKWHRLTRAERRFYKNVCLETQRSQLCGLSKRHALYAERYATFVNQYANYQLKWA